MTEFKKYLISKSKLKLFFSCFFVLFFILNLGFLEEVNTVSVPASINYQGKILQSSVAVDSSLGMSFTIYDSLTGGTAVYTAFGSVGSIATSSITVSEGLFDVNFGLGATNVLDTSIFADYSELYLEIIVEGETLSPRKRLTAVPYAFNSKYLDGVSATSTSITSTYIPVSDENGNFDFNSVTSTKLTVTATTTAKNILPSTNFLYNLGSSLFRWLKGWFVDLETTNLIATNATSTNLNVINTATIENAIITSSTLTNSNIENLTATNVTSTNFYTNDMVVGNEICDSLGNCFVPTDVANIYSPVSIIEITTTTYRGNLGGYVGGNNICDAYLSGSHLCTAEEILYLIQSDDDPVTLFNGFDYAWLSNGPPGDLAPSNDCNGWNSSADTYYGPVWDWAFSTTTGGRGLVSPCDGLKPIACCK